MDTIDVHDLPEPVAQAVARTVHTLREQLQKKPKSPRPFPTWSLGVKEPLRREDIYEEYFDGRYGTHTH